MNNKQEKRARKLAHRYRRFYPDVPAELKEKIEMSLEINYFSGYRAGILDEQGDRGNGVLVPGLQLKEMQEQIKEMYEEISILDQQILERDEKIGELELKDSV